MADGLLARYGLGGSSLSDIQGEGGVVYGYRLGMMNVGVVIQDGIATRVRPRLGQAINMSMNDLATKLQDHCVDLSYERIYDVVPKTFRGSIAALKAIQTRGKSALTSKEISAANREEKESLLRQGRTNTYLNGWYKGDENNLWDVRDDNDGTDVVYGNKVRYAGYLEVGAPRSQGRTPHYILRDALRRVSEDVTKTFQQRFNQLLGS